MDKETTIVLTVAVTGLALIVFYFLTLACAWGIK